MTLGFGLAKLKWYRFGSLRECQRIRSPSMAGHGDGESVKLCHSLLHWAEPSQCIPVGNGFIQEVKVPLKSFAIKELDFGRLTNRFSTALPAIKFICCSGCHAAAAATYLRRVLSSLIFTKGSTTSPLFPIPTDFYLDCLFILLG